MAKVACPAANKDLRLGLGCASELSYDEDFLSLRLSKGLKINVPQPCLGKAQRTGKGARTKRVLGPGAGLGWQRGRWCRLLPLSLRAFLQSGRPWILSTLAAARTVGRITALGSCPKSTVPATSYGCSWRQDQESCVSPLLACCTKKGGKGPRWVQFGSPPEASLNYHS